MTEEQFKDERTHERWRWVYPLVAVFVSMFVAVGLNIAYTSYKVHQDEQNWCEVVVSVDDGYQKTPPVTDAGRAFASSMHRLRERLNCK